jgi:hypothetical protein
MQRDLRPRATSNRRRLDHFTVRRDPEDPLRDLNVLAGQIDGGLDAATSGRVENRGMLGHRSPRAGS